MNLAPEVMDEVFDIESPCPLQNELRFKSRNIRTIRYGTETAALVGSRKWNYMPSELKESMPLNVFRSKLKTWNPENCPCKPCKIYLQRIDYLQVTNQYLLIDTIIYVYLFACFAGGVFCFFLLSPPPPYFKVDLNQPQIPDKDYICSLIYFLFICIFYWLVANK